MTGKVISFVLGVAVAATCYEATGLRIWGGRSEPAALSGSPQIAVATASSPAFTKLTSTSPPPPALPAPSGHTADLQTDLAEAKTRAEYAERQLEAIEGAPVPWPDKVAPVFKQQSVEQQLKEYVVDRGLGTLKSINCSEYPCVQVVQLTDASPEGSKALQAALSEMVKRYYNNERVALGIQGAKVKNGSDLASYAGVSIAPMDHDVRSRARYRAKLELDEHSQ